MRGLAILTSCLALALAGCGGTSPLSSGWDYTGGPYAQDITAVLAPSRMPVNVFAGTSTGDLFETSDAGKTWSRLSSISPGAALFELAEDPEVGGRLYAATATGVFVSSDAGKAWTRMPVGGQGTTTLPCRTLAIDPWKPAVLYAGTAGRGIFKSTDGGAVWSPIVTGEDPVLAFADVYDIKIDVAKPDVVYAALAPLGLMRSTDAGTSWFRLTPEVSAEGATVTHVLVNPNARDEILYGTSSGNIFKSTDGGSSFVQSRKGNDYDRVNSLVNQPGTTSLVVAGTEYGIALSTDFGNSWQTATGGLSGVPLSAAAGATTQGTSLYAFGEGVGLQLSSDGGRSWDAIDKDLGGAYVWLIRSDRSGKRVLAASGRTIFQFDPETTAWLPAGRGIRGPTLNTFTVLDDSSSVLYAATPAGVFKTADGGQSWQQSLRKLSIIPTFIDMHPTIRTRMFASSEKGLFVSTDRGNSWGQARPFRSSFSIHSFTYMPTNAGTILGATTEGVIATSDGGFNWEQPRFGMGAPEIVAVTLAPRDPATYFAWTAKGGCFRSTNRGLEWNNYTPPWGNDRHIDIAVDRHQPSSAVAVAEGRDVYYTSSGGATWHRVCEKTPPLDITALHWNAVSACLYVGTRNAGVFRISLGELVKKLGEQPGPSE
jgi:photosystem II stability/assembly factor-like uncharacterized protein